MTTFDRQRLALAAIMAGKNAVIIRGILSGQYDNGEWMRMVTGRK